MNVFRAWGFCICAFFLSATGQTAPSSVAWEFWQTSDEQSTVVVSHEKWQTILDRYLTSTTSDGVNLFAYKSVTADHKKQLKLYIQELSVLDPRQLNKAEQYAYWINLYNALTVDVVLDEYPVKSIRKIRFITSLFGPWDKTLASIAGEEVSLNDIEHRILRPIWQDARIHFAVNCASIGCPNLQAEAFTADNAEALLELGAEQFINHPRGVSRQGSTLVLSSIFDWYGADFGSSTEEVLEYLSDFLEDEKLSFIDSPQNLNYQYDWTLNEG